MINVKLTGQFINLAPEGSDKGLFTVPHTVDMTLSALIAQIGIKDTGLNYTVFVNNDRKPEDYVLEDSDSIMVMPLLAGG